MKEKGEKETFLILRAGGNSWFLTSQLSPNSTLNDGDKAISLKGVRKLVVRKEVITKLEEVEKW